MIFTFGQHLALIANPNLVLCSTAEVLQFGKTVAKDTGMSGYQNSEAMSAYRFGLTLVWRFGDITIVVRARNRHYEPVMSPVSLYLCIFAFYGTHSTADRRSHECVTCR